MAETANKQCVEDINDCSSISADASLPEESVDSDCNERCVKVGSESPADSCYPPAKSSCEEPVCGPVNNINDGEHSTIRTVTEANGNEKRRPAFSITFRNRDMARKYRKAVKQFFKELIRKHEPEEDDCDASDLELDIWEDDAAENSSEHSVDDLFTIDTTPALKDSLDIPAYDRKFSVVDQKEPEQKSALSTCFNCMGDHSLRDCPKPRDPTVIGKNRREFMNKHGNYSRVSRYHLDDDQRFARFVPGELSNELSKALGLSHNQLPRHIYRMRLLGYPPGWMEDAKVSHSGLAMFDSQGQEVADPEDEEGEIVTGDSRDKYDIKKIISFPGFNVAPKPGTKDDSEYYRCPPIQDMHSKQKMLSSLQSKETRSYKRKRLSALTAKRTEKLEEPIHSQSDMEVEEVPDTVNLLPDDDCRFIPPLPKDTPPRPPPPPSTTESDSEGGECRSQEPCSPLSTGHSSLSSPRAQSPSLSDLEAKKRQLLAELEDGGSSSDNNLTQKATPTTPNLGRVKSVSLGTPILKSASPFSRLPEPEKFSKNICDVINFENLPDSTGKYEQMSGIIKKVRTVVARMHEQDE